MHKVVVERPRWNPGPWKQHRRANLSDEPLPRYEGIRRPHTNRKCFTDLLGPLRRWLHAQAGRPLICRSNAHDIYGRAVYCVSKRQLSHRALKQFGVSKPAEPGRGTT